MRPEFCIQQALQWQLCLLALSGSFLLQFHNLHRCMPHAFPLTAVGSSGQRARSAKAGQVDLGVLGAPP